MTGQWLPPAVGLVPWDDAAIRCIPPLYGRAREGQGPVVSWPVFDTVAERDEYFSTRSPQLHSFSGVLQPSPMSHCWDGAAWQPVPGGTVT